MTDPELRVSKIENGTVSDHLPGSQALTVLASLGIDGTGKIKEYTLDAGRSRGDVWENCIWAESVTVEDSDLYLFQAIHQEADVVPENVDAVRALSERTASAEASIQRTDEALGVGRGLVQDDDGAPRPEGTADD